MDDMGDSAGADGCPREARGQWSKAPLSHEGWGQPDAPARFVSASTMSAEHKGRGEVNPSVNTRVLNNWYFYFSPSVRWTWHASLFAQLSCLYVLLPK